MDVEGVFLWDGDVGQDVEGIGGFFHGDVVAPAVALSPGARDPAGVVGAGELRFICCSHGHQWGRLICESVG